MRRGKISSTNRLKPDGPPLGSHAPTHPRTHAPTNPTSHAQTNADWGGGGGPLSAHSSWPPRWRQPGKPESSGSQKAIYQESYFPQRGCDDDMRPTRLTADVENMPVSGQKIASRQHLCVLLVINLIHHDRFLAGGDSHAAPIQEQKQEQEQEQKQEQDKNQEQVWCVHPLSPSSGRTICHSGRPFFSLPLVGPRPCPRRPTAFRFSLTTTNPDCTAPNHPAPFQASLVRPLDWPPRALVCVPRIHTDPCHLTDGKKEGEGEKKKVGPGTSTSSGPLDILHPHLTGVDHTEDVPHHHEPPDGPRPAQSWPPWAAGNARYGPPLHGERASIRLPLFPSQHTSATSPTGTGTSTSTSTSTTGPLFVMSWSRKPQPPACLCL